LIAPGQNAALRTFVKPDFLRKSTAFALAHSVLGVRHGLPAGIELIHALGHFAERDQLGIRNMGVRMALRQRQAPICQLTTVNPDSLDAFLWFRLEKAVEWNPICIQNAQYDEGD
jgi:hypothetical protein